MYSYLQQITGPVFCNWLTMVKGSEDSTTGTNRGKSVGSLQKIPERTVAAHHEEGQVNESVDLPSLEECRYLDDQGQHIDIEKLHHYHHYRTIAEREQFESKIRQGLLSMKDIAALQERLAMEKNDDSNVLAGMSDSIEMSGT